MRKFAGLVFATAVFILNPAFMGCGNLGFSFSAKEMNAALTGTWKLTSEQHTLTFRIEQQKGEVQSRAPGLVSEAAACGSRTLIASARACVDETKMPLKLIALDGSSKSLKGTFTVHGTDFVKGYLQVTVDGTSIDAQVSADGTVTDIQRGYELVHTR